MKLVYRRRGWLPLGDYRQMFSMESTFRDVPLSQLPLKPFSLVSRFVDLCKPLALDLHYSQGMEASRVRVSFHHEYLTEGEYPTPFGKEWGFPWLHKENIPVLLMPVSSKPLGVSHLQVMASSDHALNKSAAFWAESDLKEYIKRINCTTELIPDGQLVELGNKTPVRKRACFSDGSFGFLVWTYTPDTTQDTTDGKQTP